MKQRFIYVFLFFGMLFVSCSADKNSKEFMVNSWQTTYLKIEMPTHQKSDSLNVYEDKFENNPELIAQSNYKSDGTFTSWFLNKKGEKISESNGKWQVKEDSLFVQFFYNGRDMKVSYHIKETDEGFIAKSKYDWDEDGDFDDILTMKTKKIKLYN
jgi:hypothetical protein